jgi:hypothetical protein
VSRSHDAPDVLTGVNVRSRTGPPGQKAGVDNASVRIKIAQIAAEPAKHTEPVDPGVGTQVKHAFIPTFHQLPADGLRNHSLLEAGAVETVDDIRRLVTREELMKVKVESPDQQKQLHEFLEEHARVAAERDQAKQDASFFASEFDRLDDEVKKLEWRCKDYQGRLDAVGDGAVVDIATLLPVLPTTLAQVAEAAAKFFQRLVITEAALEAARDYDECKSLCETWEMLRHLNETMYRTKFEEGSKEIEKTFQDRTGYEVAMKEGPNTKNDKKLMDLRKLVHDGHEFDISPHLKHGNKEPKLVRIYFAFDENRSRYFDSGPKLGARRRCLVAGSNSFRCRRPSNDYRLRQQDRTD